MIAICKCFCLGSSNQADVNVTIAGTECDIQSLSDTEITCRTGAHKPATQTKVRVDIGSNGIATQDLADFEYIDVWSSIYTWGGKSLPEAGEMVVIPSNMTVLLDMDTPVFKMILIRGEISGDAISKYLTLKLTSQASTLIFLI